jgi:hypothetical protein
MKQRKPIFIIDDSINSQIIKKIFIDNEVDFVEYHIKKFEESGCCGDLPSYKAPSLIAADGIYKEATEIKNYIINLKENQKKQEQHIISNDKDNNKDKRVDESEGAYW